MSGLFVLANTLLKHIEDLKTGDPDEHLGEVLAFLWHSHLIGSRNPMHDLNLFYTRILSVIPNDHWSIICQILVPTTFSNHQSDRMAVQPICNLLGITRTKFYAVMQRLHSIVDIPEPSDATSTPLHFFHATFLDYLTNPNHAGWFSIGKLVTEYGVTITAEIQDFFILGLQCLESTMGISLINAHQKEVWGNQEVSQSLKAALSWPSGDHSNLDDQLLGVLCSFDLNVLALVFAFDHLHVLFPPDHLIQLSISEWDQALLSKVAVEYPDMEPFDFDADEDGFFLLGDGTNSVAVVTTNQTSRHSGLYFISQKMPSEVWPALQHTSISWDDPDIDLG
ncbi:hypothetical protein P691DRAFT_767002 [Macrolepiota fuliginosa MF-IS2]|uniref:Uncharacterized protein n=1 Tax=Macrolepiota fuliginosa MF-IS2 TaxID=1400762 RepID=A0A9P6BWW2_9AGAR|nr:hypothetical protein P691DRAFT_767002 [Macrolepiota fuliginosa MF-IS2]